MKYLFKVLTIAMLTATVTVACVEEPSVPFNEIEKMALEAWINKYRPDLKDNYQENGGYYVEILDEGCADSLPVAGKSSWVWYDFTGRDLQGNVCVSRDDAIAQQQGSYTAYTHYVPYYRFCGENNYSMLEGTYLAIYNELKIGDKSYKARYGTKMRLYLPSSVVSNGTGLAGDGGYEGQFSLDGNKPMIVEITLYGHTNNPVAYEGNQVDSFANINGGICTEHRKESTEDKTETSSRRRFTRADGDEEEEIDPRPLEFFDGKWHQPVDTLAQLYVKYAYSPDTDTFDFNAIGADTLMYPDQNIYNRGRIYGSKSMAAIDREINEALTERFGKGITYDQVLATDSVTSVSNAKIWYIARLLDGYIVDTNIDEVKRIAYGEEPSKQGSAFEFKNDDSEDNNKPILAWLYSIPTMRLGQWASILTVSTYAYGIAGKTGATNSTTTSSQSSYDWLNYYNYMNYMNSYYGYSYGGMYNNGYYGYNPYYYGYGHPYTDTSTGDEEATTVVSTTTEILPYAPMLFQIYIEPAEDKE